ncbi:porin PorA family protein [Nocardia sp. NPDC052278]|uniref:porin PorA family protein n=1 Tax=unclassified Nocardia TaxID=2637762 RepID=UPI003696C881
MLVRKLSVVCLAVGVVLVLAAAIIRFAVLPGLMKLPADLDQSQKYEGTMQAVDPAAFAANDLAHLLTPEMPITADRSLRVDTVDGDTAIVTSKALMKLPDGSKQSDVHTYAISRVDYTPVNISQGQASGLVSGDDRATFEQHEGVVLGWPMNPPKDGTTLYDPVTRTAQPAKFIAETKLEGRDVYEYRVDAGGPIASPVILGQFKSFPSQLPKAAVAALLQAGVVPEPSREALSAGLSSVPEMVDVHFTSKNVVDVAVDRRFGAPLKAVQTQRMYASIPVDGKDVPVLPLSTVKLHTADSEVASAAHTLGKNALVLSLLRVWGPISMLVIGVALVAIGLFRWRKVSSGNASR